MEQLIRCIDTETTGFPDDQRAELVEVAAVDWRPDKTEKHYASLVRPVNPIPVQTMGVHHITNAAVADAPNRADVIPNLFGAPIYACHNMRFDRHFLPELDGAYWIDTYRVAQRQLEAPSYGLQPLRYFLDEGWSPPGEAGQVAHRALYDAFCVAFLIDRFLSMGVTAKEMIQISREPAVLRRIPFGKERGKAFSDVDDGWLQWAASKSDDEDVRFTAERELRKRRGELVA